MKDEKEIEFDECVISPLTINVDPTANKTFGQAMPPVMEKNTPISAQNTTRVGRWGEKGSFYELGESKIRLFSGVIEPPPADIGDSDSWEKYYEAAKWGLKEVVNTEATAFMERIDFAAIQNEHVVITGFYNVTTDRWAWATIFIRNGGSSSGAYFSGDDHRWLYHYDWVIKTWLTGSDHKEIRLQYADKEGQGLAWMWLF